MLIFYPFLQTNRNGIAFTVNLLDGASVVVVRNAIAYQSIYLDCLNQSLGYNLHTLPSVLTERSG